MEIHISHTPSAMTTHRAPEYPWIRFDTGMMVYEEALVGGQLLGANWSAMGRPKSRERLWREMAGGAASHRPLRRRQHAFQLQVDGQDLTDRWEWVDESVVDEEGRDARECIVTLRHGLRPITVKVYTRLDGTTFVERWLEITNTGDAPAAIAGVAPWSGMIWSAHGVGQRTPGTAGPFSIGRYRTVEAIVEGGFDWESLPEGTLRVETLHGRSGWGIPFCILRNEVTHENFVAHFAWSGNWQIDCYNDYSPTRQDAQLYCGVGLAGAAPIRVLDPGETARTPAVHLGHLYGDLDVCVNAVNDHLRRSVILPLPEGKVHPVGCNHTGYTGNEQITDEQLIEEVDVAADVGVELLIIDAGWFGDAEGNWGSLVGDWDESPLLKGGLRPIIDHIHDRGLMAGLWVEIERVAHASKIMKDHPEWLMTRRGETIPQLDLAKPVVAKHVEDTICGLVEKYALDCYRLDYNISPGEGPDLEREAYAENTLWRYYDALHQVFDNVRARFPHLLFENCSSGGGRMDMGMLSRFHWTQTTDQWAPGPTLKIHNGVSIALPPEQCMTLLGAISGGRSDVDFMLRIGLFGHFTVSGIFPTMAERHAASRERWIHNIRLFKEFVRPILTTCRVFHHTPIQRQTETGEWCVLEHAAPDGSRAYAGIFRYPGAVDDTYHLRPKGLSVSRRYRVTYDNTGQTREMDGGDILDRGLTVRVPGAFQSELLLFEAIAD